MKILVMSDSHGNNAAIRSAINAENPDFIMHLGDCDVDTKIIKQEFPNIPFRVVSGNVDYGWNGRIRDDFILKGKLFMLVHGHVYKVKEGKELVIEAAKEKDADILLFGHTHVQYFEEIDGLIVLNPGSIGYDKREYAVVELYDGEVKCELKNCD